MEKSSDKDFGGGLANARTGTALMICIIIKKIPFLDKKRYSKETVFF